MQSVIELGLKLKRERNDRSFRPLDGQTWVMIFTKASTRTRVSFDIGVHELGGRVLYLNPADSQLGRGEPVRDTARVIGRMAHGAIIRTFAQSDVEEFAEASGIPTINALTDEEHPCQVLADLLTMVEICGGYEGRTVAFLGDGDNNMSRSWMWAAEKLGFRLVIAAPPAYQPSREILSRFRSGNIRIEPDAAAAVADADVVYTDVWTSMGQESESDERSRELQPYQINDALLRHARPGVAVMHCLPAYRGKEITAEVMEAHAETIFRQSENRLHAQKGILALLER